MRLVLRPGGHQSVQQDQRSFANQLTNSQALCQEDRMSWGITKAVGQSRRRDGARHVLGRSGEEAVPVHEFHARMASASGCCGPRTCRAPHPMCPTILIATECHPVLWVDR
jgi:hypothetical protein